ncbi:MAG TPA: 30S ribosomal protein S13 [Candidatus Paceibacterota bacterium]
MMRIAGTNIPDNKKLQIALTYVFGVGISRAKQILKETGVPLEKRAKELSLEESNKIRDFIAKFKVEGELRREISSNIKRLKDIKSYRGIRHMKRLPVRGQRTKTNTRTVRGNVRVTMGSGRRKTEKT